MLFLRKWLKCQDNAKIPPDSRRGWMTASDLPRKGPEDTEKGCHNPGKRNEIREENDCVFKKDNQN